MRVTPSLLVALAAALSACSLERSPLLPDGVDVPSAGSVTLPGGSGGAGSAGGALAGSGGGQTAGVGGEASSGAGAPSAGIEPTAGVAPPIPGPDAGALDAGGPPDAGPALPDAGPPPTTPDFVEGSCPAGFDCLPFLFLGFMCQQNAILLACDLDNTCPYDAPCGTMSGAPGPVCFLNCVP